MYGKDLDLPSISGPSITSQFDSLCQKCDVFHKTTLTVNEVERLPERVMEEMDNHRES